MIEQRSKEWFEQRKGRVTGSMVGAILGIAPYMTREQAMRSMVRAYHGAEPEFSGNVATDWGTANEPGALVDFTMETGLSVSPAPFVPFSDWAGASPDGYVENGGLIEVKCPYKFRKEPNPNFLSAKEQPHYYAQMQFQMHCTGESKCYFYQWAPHGSCLEMVAKDIEWESEYLPKLIEFYSAFKVELSNPEHLADARIVIETDLSKKLVDEYDELTEAEERAKNRKAEVLEELVILSGGLNACVSGRNLTRTKRDGSISYAKAIKDLDPDADLSKYRGKASEFWKLY